MTRCAACSHFRTAHPAPHGPCQLCDCTGWTEPEKETVMADIGEPLREVTFEPLEQPLTAPAQPAEPVTVPDREPVPA